MFRAWGFLLPIAAVVSSAPASAQQAAITYDCDKGAHQFSRLVLPAPEGPFIVSGHVEVKQTPPPLENPPMASLAIAKVRTAPDQPPPVSAGFELAAMGAKSISPRLRNENLTIQFVTWNEQSGTQFKKGRRFGVESPRGELDFSLSFAAGTVTAKVGPEENRFMLEVRNPVVLLTCANGEVFSNLKIEKSATPATGVSGIRM